MPDLPLPKRFPGRYCMRSTMWIPDKKLAHNGHSYKIGFEGALHPSIAEALLALQLHQGKVTPEMIEQLKAMTEALNPPVKKASE